MTRHTIRSDSHQTGAFVGDTYEPDAIAPRFSHRLVVPGTENGGIGYGIGTVPPGLSARQTNGGRLIPGPWAYTFGLAAVIDNHGGSRREIDAQRAAGKLIEADPGDVLVIDGRPYVLTVDARRYPALTEEVPA